MSPFGDATSFVDRFSNPLDTHNGIPIGHPERADAAGYVSQISGPQMANTSAQADGFFQAGFETALHCPYTLLW